MLKQVKFSELPQFASFKTHTGGPTLIKRNNGYQSDGGGTVTLDGDMLVWTRRHDSSQWQQFLRIRAEIEGRP